MFMSLIENDPKHLAFCTWYFFFVKRCSASAELELLEHLLAEEISVLDIIDISIQQEEKEQFRASLMFISPEEREKKLYATYL